MHGNNDHACRIFKFEHGSYTNNNISSISEVTEARMTMHIYRRFPNLISSYVTEAEMTVHTAVQDF